MAQEVFYQRLHGNVDDILAAGRGPLKAPEAAIFLCRQGTVRLLLDEREYLLKPQSLCVYFPYSVLQVLQRSDDVDGIMLSVDIESVQPIVTKILDIDALFTIHQSPVRHLTEEQYSLILQYTMLLRHHQELSKTLAENDQRRFWQLNNLQYNHVKDSLVLQIILAFTDQNSLTKSVIDRKDTIVHNFISSLRQNFVTEHEVGFYAQQQYLSMRYFSFVVREKTGKTPSQWIANALLSHAKELLLETDKTIKQVSDELHFPNQSYFGKWFKAKVGMGPIEFKRSVNHGKESV